MKNDNFRPKKEKEKAICLILGQASGKDTIKEGGDEYCVVKVDENNTRYFNPLINAEDAMELFVRGGFDLLKDHENNSFICVVGGKHAVPGSTFNMAICMASYATITGQLQQKDIKQVLVPDNKMIIPGR